jgi:exopolysaccharide biosynthesis polyprenyl glycosylphosphotransferase
MIKYSNLYLPSRMFVIAALDLISITLALVLAFNAGSGHGGLVTPFPQTIVALALAVIVCLWCFYFFDLYDLDATRRVQDVLLQSLRALGTSILLIAPIWWFMLPSNPSYYMLEVNLVSFLVALCVYRLVAQWLHNRVFPGERILLVGSSRSIQLLAEAMHQKLCLPLKLSGIVAEGEVRPLDRLAFATCGQLSDFAVVTQSFHPDRIAIGLDSEAEMMPTAELVELRMRGVRVDDAGALYEAITGRVPVALLDPRRLAFGRGFRLSHFGAVTCRAASFVFASIALVVLSPFLLLIAIAIKLDSRGPVIFQQKRVGLHGKVFDTVKFRSMRTDAESLSGPVWAMDNDPRVTRVGRVMRLLRLDELPQLWNVIRGEMSIIGPRPERPHFVAMLREQLPFYDLRHSILPGITGWAQVCASYGSNIDESREKLEYDLFYLKNRSPLLDTLIFFKTIKIMIFGRGAR